jgi:hypothetical protein
MDGIVKARERVIGIRARIIASAFVATIMWDTCDFPLKTPCAVTRARGVDILREQI